MGTERSHIRKKAKLRELMKRKDLKTREQILLALCDEEDCSWDTAVKIWKVVV